MTSNKLPKQMKPSYPASWLPMACLDVKLLLLSWYGKMTIARKLKDEAELNFLDISK